MAEYLGVQVSIPSNDADQLEFLQAAGENRFVVQKCAGCGVLRYPPARSCAECQSLEHEWEQLSGKGAVYSYEIVTQPLSAAYRERAPYAVVLIELDEQRGEPSPDQALRVISSLVDADGNPEQEENVAIGLRVEVDFADMGDGLGLPRFRLSDEPPEHEPWRLAE